MSTKSLTTKFCPQCKSIHPIRVIAFKKKDMYNQKDRNFQRSYDENVAKTFVNYFVRKTQCQNCQHVWVTGELPMGDLVTLISRYHGIRDAQKLAGESVAGLVKENTSLKSEASESKEIIKKLKETLQSLSVNHTKLLAELDGPNDELVELKGAMAVFMKHALGTIPETNLVDGVDK